MAGKARTDDFKTPLGRLSYAQTLFKPRAQEEGKDPKYGCTIIFPKAARAELEKANARMLFDIRKTLTPDQWQKLKTMREEHHDGKMMRDDRRGPGGPDGPGGPGGRDGQMWRNHRQGPPPDGTAPAPPPPAQGQPQASPPSANE